MFANIDNAYCVGAIKIKGHEILFFDPLPAENLAEKFFEALVGVLEQYGAKKVFVEK